jgi:hypothetical protein
MSVSVEYEHSSFRNIGPSNGPKTQTGDFPENGSNEFDYVSANCGERRSTAKCISGIFRNITGSTLLAQTPKCGFVVIDFTGLMDFVAVRSSVTSNGIVCYSRFRFQSEVVMVIFV